MEPRSSPPGTPPDANREPIDALPKHPKQDELPIAEHGIIGNMQSALFSPSFFFPLF
jgi:hypothetical protein